MAKPTGRSATLFGVEVPEDDRVAFCEREYPRLVGSLTLYVGDRDLAVELAQEALARACQHWRRVGRMGSPGAWVHRVGINLANSVFVRRRAERSALHRCRSSAEVTMDEDGTVALVLREAVAALPKRQRAAVVLRFYADLTVAEVAELMGCAEGTVKALTHQGIGNLRKTTGLRDDEQEVNHVP